MKINEKCPLVLTNLYFYDFKSCFPNLLKNINYEFEGVDVENKVERNIHIGTIQKDNEELQNYLNKSTELLLEHYLEINDIDINDVIISQRDGFILKNQLKVTDDFMKLDLREIIDVLIITPDRKKFMYYNDTETIIKGVSHMYQSLYQVYNLFKRFCFYDKSILFQQMNSIKKYVLESQDKNLFIINSGNEKIIQSNQGTIKINTEKDFLINNVNKQKYYEHYFKEFMDSVFLTFY